MKYMDIDTYSWFMPFDQQLTLLAVFEYNFRKFTTQTASPVAPPFSTRILSSEISASSTIWPPVDPNADPRSIPPSSARLSVLSVVCWEADFSADCLRVLPLLLNDEMAGVISIAEVSSLPVRSYPAVSK